MSDPTEAARRQRVAEINQGDTNRAELEAQHGQVWSTDEMTAEFSVIGFMSPYVIVMKNGIKGSLEFRHSPRFYFNFQPE